MNIGLTQYLEIFRNVRSYFSKPFLNSKLQPISTLYRKEISKKVTGKTAIQKKHLDVKKNSSF